MKRILVLFGTRPEAIKLSPVVRLLRDRRDEADLTVCSTGQHGQMLDDTMRSLQVTLDRDLKLMRADQHPTDLLGRLLMGLRAVIEEARPHTVVVQGDTMTAMAGSLAGFLGGAEVGHVEAGLRTRDKHAPFPEEINRRVTGVVADHHFPPTERARDALIAEGVPGGSVHLTGNTVVDALRWVRAELADRPPTGRLRFGEGRLVLVTAHRRESFGKPFRSLCQALRDIAERFDDVQVVYPVHLNPNVQGPVHEILDGCPRVHLIEPQPYMPFVELLVRSHLVLTDSGGIQEEAPSLGKPVLVLREKTERPEAVEAGVVRLVGTDRDRIVTEAGRLLTDQEAYTAMAREVDLYGDGRAAARVVEVLLEGRMSSPPFKPSV